MSAEGRAYVDNARLVRLPDERIGPDIARLVEDARSGFAADYCVASRPALLRLLAWASEERPA